MESKKAKEAQRKARLAACIAKAAPFRKILSAQAEEQRLKQEAAVEKALADGEVARRQAEEAKSQEAAMWQARAAADQVLKEKAAAQKAFESIKRQREYARLRAEKKSSLAPVDPQIAKEAADLKAFLEHPARAFLSRKALALLDSLKDPKAELNEKLRSAEFRSDLEVLARQ